MIYIINQTDGKALDFDVHAAANNALNITVAAYPTSTGYVAYNGETLNGLQQVLYYDANMTLVKADTLGQGGGSSNLSAVGRNADGSRTAVGLRPRTTGDYKLLNEDPMNFADKTNWYSILAVLKTQDQTTAVKHIETKNGKTVKFFENGQLYILHKGTKYNVQGMIIR